MIIDEKRDCRRRSNETVSRQSKEQFSIWIINDTFVLNREKRNTSCKKTLKLNVVFPFQLILKLFRVKKCKRATTFGFNFHAQINFRKQNELRLINFRPIAFTNSDFQSKYLLSKLLSLFATSNTSTSIVNCVFWSNICSRKLFSRGEKLRRIFNSSRSIVVICYLIEVVLEERKSRNFVSVRRYVTWFRWTNFSNTSGISLNKSFFLWHLWLYEDDEGEARNVPERI